MGRVEPEADHRASELVLHPRARRHRAHQQAKVPPPATRPAMHYPGVEVEGENLLRAGVRVSEARIEEPGGRNPRDGIEVVAVDAHRQPGLLGIPQRQLVRLGQRHPVTDGTLDRHLDQRDDVVDRGGVAHEREGVGNGGGLAQVDLLLHVARALELHEPPHFGDALGRARA